MCIYLVNQKAWLGRRERAFLYCMIALATLFQTLVYGGTSYSTPGIAVRSGPARHKRRVRCRANIDSLGHTKWFFASRQVLSSVFIACMNAAYTALVGVGFIGALLHQW